MLSELLCWNEKNLYLVNNLDNRENYILFHLNLGFLFKHLILGFRDFQHLIEVLCNFG